MKLEGNMAGIAVVVFLALGGSGVAAAGEAAWVKHEKSPVLGGKLGACLDACVLREGETYRMWFSWRPKQSISIVEGKDGLSWGEPVLALGPKLETGWESDLVRPAVFRRPYYYHLWYEARARGRSWIGHALSTDARTWKRMSAEPVLAADAPWEKMAVASPAVTWELITTVFRMWYSGGDPRRPDGVGYATSVEGNMWLKCEDNPVFGAEPKNAWEQHSVAVGQVVRCGEWHYLFYAGFRDASHAQLGLARSKDGVTNWQRHPRNPILGPTPDAWDHDSCEKPYALFDEKAGRWLLWYNGRKGDAEQIGLATRQGQDLGFGR